ncbi:LPD29 domain-containing protein [Flavobacterium sp. FlaQc-50]|uniref:LPD29 domain-containing protein n=1 Tax=unclassified Flavobacterium TaxID=196869 RepID=UPI003756BF34
MRTLGLKANRVALQQAEFERLIQKGYKLEKYDDLNIFTMTDEISTWLKVFRGTATKEIVYKRYKTVEQSNEKVKELKASHDRNKAYKADLKNNPTKSSSANCATAIREELKKDFPNVKFSVKSSNFAGGDSVSITWADGPTTEQIEGISRKYAYGRFDSMQDLSYSVINDALPQAKYVQTRREIGDNVNKVVFDALRKYFHEDVTDHEINQYKYRIIEKSPIPVGAVVTGLQETNKSGAIEDTFCLGFDLSNVSEPKAEAVKAEFEKVEVAEGEIQIIDYSEKAIAIIGDTKPIKDKLKELGGKFNFRLSCGAGWIFPKTKLAEIETLLTA